MSYCYPQANYPASYGQSSQHPAYQPSPQYPQVLPRGGGQNQPPPRRNVSPRQSNHMMSRGRSTRAPAPASQSHPSTSQPTNPSPPSTKAHICLHPGCLSTFARAYDLDRHQKTHFPTTAKRYDCQFAPVCNRYGERTEKWKGGFTREDHYIEHLRKVHGEDIAKGRRRSGGGGQVLGVRGCS